MTLPYLRTTALALPVSHHWLVLRGTPLALHRSHLSGYSSEFPVIHTLLSEKQCPHSEHINLSEYLASCTLHVHTNTEPCCSLLRTKRDVATIPTQQQLEHSQQGQDLNTDKVKTISELTHHTTSYTAANNQKVSCITMPARRKSAETV